MIENRQKTPSGPQGVLLGVPKDPQTTQMAIQDAKMWLPKLTNIKLWCQKGGKPESRRVKDWGPAVFFYRKNAYKMLRNLSIVVKIRGLRSRRAKIYEYFALF